MTNERTTLADLIDVAIFVGETRRMVKLAYENDEWQKVADANNRMAEQELEARLHEFARINHTQPF